MSRLTRAVLAALAAAAFALPLRSEVILQYFESDWDEVYRRLPEIAEIGYDAIWTPSPCKSPIGASMTWANVGYSLYDRFDLGDVPQAGTLATRYGTRGHLRQFVDNAHYCDVKIYPDVVFNHNGNGPSFHDYPGMKANDFHVWANGSQPGGYQRANRMNNYDEINSGGGRTFQEELVSLIDVVTEPDARFSINPPNYAAEPAEFIRHPGRPDLYPYGAPGPENVREMLGRWIAWLGNAMDYDGLRLDAAKHVVHEFYGTAGQIGGFLHEAQYRFDFRRGLADSNEYDQMYQNDVRRDDLLLFAEIFTGASATFDYWRNGGVKMRFLDFPFKQGLVGNAFGGNIGALGSLGVALDPTEGVTFVQSHDQQGPSNLDLGYAYTLTHVGIPIVYFTGNNLQYSDTVVSGNSNARTWMLMGHGGALGDYSDGRIPNLVYIHNQFARGKEWGRYSSGDVFAYERYEDLDNDPVVNPPPPDVGESTLLMALNDTSSQQTISVATAFPNGTVLHDHTGNQPSDVTVSGGSVTLTIPGTTNGRSWVAYAPYVASANGEPIRFVQGGSNAPTMNWLVPAGVHAPAKPVRQVPRLTANTIDIDIHFNDPVGGTATNVLVKWGQGRNLNGSAPDNTGNGIVAGGYEQATAIGAGHWRLTADLTGVPEGLHVVKGRVFNQTGAGIPARFQTFTKAVYVDRTGPGLVVEWPSTNATLEGDGVAVIQNPDRTCYYMECRVDGGAWSPAHQFSKGTWKFNLTGHAAGAHTLEVRAIEHDQNSPSTQINSSTVSVPFNVDRTGPVIALNHAEGATLNLPFFTTSITASNATTANVRLWWDGYEMAYLQGPTNGTVTHVFGGGFASGGVTQQLWGAFVNGPHFFEAEIVSGGQTNRVTRTVFFNLFGQNLVDSDGDGLPNDVEMPNFSSGTNPGPNGSWPGDNNQDMIPNNGENWTRLNPMNKQTFYSGSWDGDRDNDGDGVSNLEEVRRGFTGQGNPFYYDIYNAGSVPPASQSAALTTTLSQPGGSNQLAITYRPNDGPLTGVSPIWVDVTYLGETNSLLLGSNGSGGWTNIFFVPGGVLSVNLSFRNAGSTLFDNATGYQNISTAVPVQRFVMDGQFDSTNFQVAINGMKVLAARRSNSLYVATWSANNSGANGSDHFLLLTDRLSDQVEPAPWAKSGTIHFNKALRPWLAAESDSGTNGFKTFNNAGAGGRVAMGPGGGALEGEIDLLQVFGYIPERVFVAALAYGDSDGGGIGASGQAPPPWDSVNNDVPVLEFQAVDLDSIRDENNDGHFDGGDPSLTTTVNGNTADANYGLRRFFLDERTGESSQITVTLAPNAGPTNTVSDVQLISNLNRRDFATLDQNLALLTPADNTVYTRAYVMPLGSNGTYSVTLPVLKCGVYRINARYRVNGGPWVYYADNSQRRECVAVVSPRKALDVNLYEVNPLTVEATNTTFAGRSTLQDLYVANTNKPDVLNINHYPAIGVNMLWLQPIHPVGVEARGTNSLGQPYDPGSPYAARDYWTINPVLSAQNTEAAALEEFTNMVAALDGAGVGVMMDGTFNHSAPDAVLGQGSVDLFPWAVSSATNRIRDVRPQWYSLASNYGERANATNEIAVAPDREDFVKWTDVRDFYFGAYDAVVRGTNEAQRQAYLLELDEFEGHDQYTREVWEYFAYYPIYWLTKTGCPPGTPKEQSHRGIDGLRCDFAQGLPSQFWEYCINKTRQVKWDFVFMAESLDGYRTVNGSKRHGVGYRSARQFDVLNENLVFYWRDQFFGYPGGGGSRSTGSTFEQLDNRRQAYDNVVILNNLTSHDEIFPSNDGYQLLYAHAQLAAVDGVPMLFYGQEAGAQNDVSFYGYTGIPDANRNFALYELNFGKNIPHFKTYNHMRNVWNNRDWTLQSLYGRVNQARNASPALRSQNNYFLARTDTSAFDNNIFAVAKFQQPGVPASLQDVVFAFVNNNYLTNRSATFKLDATISGSNWFGIQGFASYNIRDLLSTSTNFLWSTNRTGADLIANGITVILNGASNNLGQAQYLKLVDVNAPAPGPNVWATADFDADNLPDTWESQYGLNPSDASGIDGAAGDRDGDGATNYEEFLAGTDPSDRASRLRVTYAARAGTVFNLDFDSVPFLDYGIEYSYTLANWTDCIEETGLPCRVTADSTNTAFEIALPQPTAPPNIFFRVKRQR
jgi:glycosidase